MKSKILLAVLSAFLFVACGADDDFSTCNAAFNFQFEIEDELDLLNMAATNYSNEPNTSNCNAYKSAAQNYLDAVKSLEPCARNAGQLTAFDQSVESGQQTVDNINC